ncbi:MAG: ribulose-phosphate 3-epimerase [Bacilli bacterium]|nr:ribulose-phosphate 3-epimerase [Bacilli bacterium]
MKISASFLSIKENLKGNIELLDKTNIDYLHLDIMDGEFVKHTTYSIEDIKKILSNTNKPKDVHLMVNNVIKYIDDFKQLNPEFITFHLEATNNPIEIINYLKELGIKIGISIKPKTPIDILLPYLSVIDLILIMSVEPGRGGQDFIMSSVDKINYLNVLREENNYNFVIEVDGGINDKTIKHCKNADIVVVGSYITNGNDYQIQINKLK